MLYFLSLFFIDRVDIPLSLISLIHMHVYIICVPALIYMFCYLSDTFIFFDILCRNMFYIKYIWFLDIFATLAIHVILDILRYCSININNVSWCADFPSLNILLCFLCKYIFVICLKGNMNSPKARTILKGDHHLKKVIIKKKLSMDFVQRVGWDPKSNLFGIQFGSMEIKLRDVSRAIEIFC